MNTCCSLPCPCPLLFPTPFLLNFPAIHAHLISFLPSQWRRYVLFYLAFLLVRRRMGLVTDAMLRIPRRMAGLFVGMGLAEALSSLLAFIGAANLPGVVLPLLSQTVLFWQVSWLDWLEPAQFNHMNCCTEGMDWLAGFYSEEA